MDRLSWVPESRNAKILLLFRFVLILDVLVTIPLTYVAEGASPTQGRYLILMVVPLAIQFMWQTSVCNAAKRKSTLPKYLRLTDHHTARAIEPLPPTVVGLLDFLCFYFFLENYIMDMLVILHNKSKSSNEIALQLYVSVTMLVAMVLHLFFTIVEAGQVWIYHQSRKCIGASYLPVHPPDYGGSSQDVDSVNGFTCDLAPPTYEEAEIVSKEQQG